MKTRQGFVSNSSSSSFVIIGKEIKSSKLTEATFKGKNITAIGGGLYEGSLVMKMDWKMYQFFQEHAKEFEEFDGFSHITYYETFFNSTELGTINKKDLPDGVLSVITGEYDHASPSSIAELKEYLEEYL